MDFEAGSNGMRASSNILLGREQRRDHQLHRRRSRHAPRWWERSTRRVAAQISGGGRLLVAFAPSGSAIDTTAARTASLRRPDTVAARPSPFSNLRFLGPRHSGTRTAAHLRTSPATASTAPHARHLLPATVGTTGPCPRPSSITTRRFRPSTTAPPPSTH